ncbi:unnamed protein product, partial [Ectocarpus sp. 8 AP-2014]
LDILSPKVLELTHTSCETHESLRVRQGSHQKGITCQQFTAHQRFHTTKNGKHIDLSTAPSRSTGIPVGFNGVPEEAALADVDMCTHCCPRGKKQHPRSHVFFSL